MLPYSKLLSWAALDAIDHGLTGLKTGAPLTKTTALSVNLTSDDDFTT